MPYSEFHIYSIYHIEVHIREYTGNMSLSVYGYMREGVRELGREVTGGAWPKKFGDRWAKA